METSESDDNLVFMYISSHLHMYSCPMSTYVYLHICICVHMYYMIYIGISVDFISGKTSGLFDIYDVKFVINGSCKFGILTIFIKPLFKPQYPLIVFLMVNFLHVTKSFTKFVTFHSAIFVLSISQR